MFEARKVNSYIATTLQATKDSEGLVQEIKDLISLPSRRAQLARAFELADYYAKLGMPTITAACLSLTPRKAWRHKAATLSEAYKTRADKTREHLEEAHVINVRLEGEGGRNKHDLITAQALLTLSQKGQAIKPPQVHIP